MPSVLSAEALVLPELFGRSMLALALLADLGLLILLGGLALVFSNAPQLGQRAERVPGTSLTVVIPAYNEALNIEACLASVLTCAAPCPEWCVVVVDDGSTDATATLATAAAARCGGVPSPGGAEAARFTLLDAGTRPRGERWVGKNWACTRAMDQIHSEWVLFIDADVRLRPATLQRALGKAIEEGADLVSLNPRLRNGCLAEWMVQPIMACLIGLGFPISATNDPAARTAFATGMFMLFRRSAYEAIGGHRAVAADVVEDMALAKRIKGSGLRLRFLLGIDALDVRMYDDFAALWEGWSKNWFEGQDRSVIRALAASWVAVLLFSVPWLVTLFSLYGWLVRVAMVPTLAQLLALAAGLVGIGLQLGLRLWARQQLQMPLTLWWLMGIGGLVVGALGPTSVWRSLTGRGWTWKGRSLAG